MLGSFKSWLASTVHSRALIGRRLVINFPHSLDKRVGVVELPRGSSHFFVIKPSAAEGDKTASLVLICGGQESLLGVFATPEQAEAALGSVRRSFTRPLRKAVKWLIVLMLYAMMVEWATTPTMAPRAGQMGPELSAAESARQQQWAQQAAARQALEQAGRAGAAAPASEAPALTEAAPSSAAAASETAAALRLLQGK